MLLSYLYLFHFYQKEICINLEASYYTSPKIKTMKVALSFFLFLIVTVNSYTKSFKNFEIQYSNRNSLPTKILPPFNSILTMEMLKRLDELDKYENEFKIVQHNNELLALPNGFLDVLVWEDNHWGNLYKGKYGGHNFGSYKFFYKNELYSFGGYGYWQYNNLLIKFNRALGGWDFVTKLNSKDALVGPFCNLNGDKFIVTGGVIESNNGLIPNEYEYTIDVANKSCTRTNAKYLSEFEAIHNQENSNLTFTNTLVQYCKERNNYYMLIYNKKDKQYYTSDLKTPLPTASLLQYNNDERLIFYDSDSTTNILTEKDLIKSASPVGVLNKEIDTKESKGGIVVIFIFIILLGAAGFMYLKNTPKRKANVQNKDDFTAETTEDDRKSNNNEGKESILNYLDALTVVENTVITPSRLDALLEIDQLDIDSQRARRSQLIKIINEHTTENIGFDFIHRIRDEKDKRYVNYQIGKPKEK